MFSQEAPARRLPHRAMAEESEMFSMDDERRASGGAAGGSGAPAGHEGATSSHGVDVFRRAMPQVEADEDVCSICLEEFTQEDPGNCTKCGHTFHLQCIMQWAQRSRECPLCFRTLELQDTALQELLPFGEYVAPEQHSLPAALLGIESWDMDRLLQRLALQGGPGAARRTRARTRPRTVSQPANQLEGEREAAGTSRCDGAPDGASAGQLAEGEYPSSWPPSGASMQEREARGEGQGAHRLRGGGGESLKSRWSSFQSRWRESLGRGRKSGEH